MPRLNMPNQQPRSTCSNHKPVRGGARVLGRVLVSGVILLAGLQLSGCMVGALVGGMAASAERSGSKTVEAEYTGLDGKSFAVVVAADRTVTGDYPDIVPLITREVTRRLAEGTSASAMVPAEDILRFQYQRPGWVAMSPRELAKQLEVDRLVFVDLHDYTLTEPGNKYIWAGNASGVVNVLEVEKKASGASEFAWKTPVRVKFPDNEGTSTYEMPAETVAMELAKRFIQRASWPFFQHEEPNAIEY